MTNANRFAPPTVTVADPIATPTAARPVAISRAIGLSWLSLIAGLPCSISMALPTPDRALSMLTVTLTILNYAVAVLVILKLAQGRRWARTVLLALTGLSLLSVVAVTQMTRLEITSYALSVLLDVGALWLLFASTGRAWFDPHVRARQLHG